ncbi:LysR family transcriptional regulator [Streptomyces sp. NPDC003016]
MERHEIETFLTLAEELHFRRTAERLGLSQGRVSQIVQTLERRIGVPLFERTSRRVSLTPVGRRLRDGVEPAHRRIQEEIARAIAAGRGIQGVLTVGFVGAGAGEVLLQVIDFFRARHSDCEVRIREIQFGDAFSMLRDGETDMMVASFPVREDDLVTGPVLVREPQMLAVSSRHPFAGRRSVSMEDLARDAVLSVTSTLADYWIEARTPSRTPSGKVIRRGPTVSTFQEILALVAAGEGIFPVGAQVTRFYARPDIAYLPIDDAPLLSWGLVWRGAGESSRIRAFARAARDVTGVRGPEAEGSDAGGDLEEYGAADDGGE